LEKNKVFTKDFMELHADDSKVAIHKIATDEELMIALDTEQLLTK